MPPQVKRWTFALIALAALAASIFAACGGDDGDAGASNMPAADDGALTIVTTVAPITSLAENIAGTNARVIGIVPEGTNSHTFEPAPSDARTLASADIIFVNGLRLEQPTMDLAEANKKDATEIVTLGDMTVTEADWKFDFSFPKDKGDPNPHLWPNVPFALRYAQIIHDKLVALDPDNTADYDANYAKLKSRLEALDAGIKAASQTVPEQSRKLLTYHDSWAYWADTYGFTVIGAIQPSDFSEPSAKDIADLIEQVKREKVPAIFGSEVFPSDALETIADESGAEYIDDLRDDDLPGEPGGDEHSYVGLMVTNMKIMLPALGGNADALEGIPTGLVFQGESQAEYPQ
ncbi:MAG TPA: metal ABC transporter substrate-binding protein [Dehalococcoidia bacterium]|jgi:ABC-type Zn uptake system ZnuABC Zn-binding protein ZnuA|nr:metal ABC transporter substrate-binding protein [Dehalococcoidia bacterium]